MSKVTDDGLVVIHRAFCCVDIKALVDEFQWEQPTMKMYGKEFLMPRQVAFMGDAGLQYTYSRNVTHLADMWSLLVGLLRTGVAYKAGHTFNCVLANLYQDGNDKVGWHSDDEKDMSQEHSIASLSFGASRDFLLRDKETKQITKITLNNGDLLIMLPGCQEKYQHSIPVRKGVKEQRLNLTFRVAV